MSKHTAKRHKKAANGACAIRLVKRAHGKKPTRVKKAVSRHDHVLGIAAFKQQGLEPDAAELQLVDFESLGQEPERVADVVELFGVEVMYDSEDAGQNDDSELKLENRD